MRRAVLGVLSVTAAVTAGVTSPSLAIDCSKASTPVERAICADPAAKAADDAMGAAYAALIARLSPEAAAALKSSQRAFLKQREDRCGYLAGAELAACLTERTEWRTRFLSAAPETGPGLPAPLEPVMVSRAQTQTQCAADVAAFRFLPGAGLPGADVFNEAVAALLAQLEDEFGKREDPAVSGFELNCDYTLAVTVTFASPRLIAVREDLSFYTGGAHGSYGASGRAVALTTGAVPDFDDLFGADALPALVATCRDELIAEKTRRYAQAGLSAEQAAADIAASGEIVTTTLQTFSRWILYADRADVYFGAYELGSYAEGDYVCTLPAAFLRARTKDGTWLTDLP